MLLDSVTVRCAAVPTAGAFSVTVAVELTDPPTTLVGFSVSDTTPGRGVTVRIAFPTPPFSVAEMVAVAVAAVMRLVAVKLADIAPFATVTVAGTVATAVLLHDRVTVLCAAVPAAGAFKVIVPMELVIPPGTLVGFKMSEITDNGLTDKSVIIDPFRVAVITGSAATATT
jgi:hypothetical protein